MQANGSKRIDYYGLLGVEPSAGFQEIQTAYWRRALHVSRAELDLLNEAYEVLGNEDRRRAYDARRAAGKPPAAGQAVALPRRPGLLDQFLAR